ncbi:hypothetical protein CCR75_009578 [Bremia lactucae]|uniref:SUI1 domain-containing protein n=1 Tax=Bremia lactucae TaxID=4779 RepID=A0A976NYV1_BRELC|nr:hypothetical protein CCR75_009578 [Bremia lactucae]
MFAKPVKVSGNVLLKNKDAKKLRRDVTERLIGPCSDSYDDKLKQLLASKASVKKMSFQAPSKIVVYAAEETKEPLVFDTSGKGDFCFTVYALWRFPSLLPRLEVHAPASEYVLRGADVMMPGVVFASEEQLQSLQKGGVYAVYVIGNPCAIAVGEMLMDAAEVARNGKKGRALKLWHVVGDSLWQMGPQTLPNVGFLGDIVVPTGEDENAAMALEAVTLEEEKETTGFQAVTKQEMDRYYVAALLQVLRTGKIREKDLPILASTFHANVLLPCRRAGVSLNIKQSSFKKLSVFLKAMEAHGLLTLADNDGVQTITSIGRRHPDVQSHEPYKTEDSVQQEKQTVALKPAGIHSTVPGQHAPVVEESAGLPPALKTLFLSILPRPSTGQPLQKYWSITEIRELVTRYIEDQALVDPTNKEFVRLNGPLTDVIYGKKVPAGGYPDRLSRPEMFSLLQSKLTHYHRIKLFPTHAAKFYGGNLQPISIHVKRLKQRSNATITTISYYQQFGIDGVTFVKEAQKMWGCSATVQMSEDKSKTEEIQIHGHMANEVLERLATKYQINAKYCLLTYGKNMKAKKK